MNCINCDKELTNHLDTFGEVGKELCLKCFLETEAIDGDAEISDIEWCYGFFPGGDPRDFSPDYEMCTVQEVDDWKKDCAEWEAGSGQPCPPAGYWNADHTMHILAPRYGMGVYKVRDE